MTNKAHTTQADVLSSSACAAVVTSLVTATTLPALVALFESNLHCCFNQRADKVQSKTVVRVVSHHQVDLVVVVVLKKQMKGAYKLSAARRDDGVQVKITGTQAGATKISH